MIRDGVDAIVACVKSSERALALMRALEHLAQDALALSKDEPSLLPELAAVATHLREAHDAAARIVRFASVRLDATMEGLSR